jgi:hypothetical protein
MWESATPAQASRLALHTGRAGAVEWADATAAQLAAKAIELDDAIDAFHTACYLAEGSSAEPHAHTARVLFAAGRGPAAFAVLSAGLPGATGVARERVLTSLATAWDAAGLDVPFVLDRAGAQMFEALQRRDPARAEKLGRWVIACDPTASEANRNLGLALAQQGKTVDALHYLTRGTRDQATQILSGVLFQAGKIGDALAVLDHASRWYRRVDQWLGWGHRMPPPIARRARLRARVRARSWCLRCNPARRLLARAAGARPFRRCRPDLRASDRAQHASRRRGRARDHTRSREDACHADDQRIPAPDQNARARVRRARCRRLRSGSGHVRRA